MKLDHVAVVVNNVFKAIPYYKEAYSAIVIYEDPSWAMLQIGDTKIALVTKEEHKPHIAFRCDSIEDFPEGSEIKVHRDGSFYSYQEDLDGNVIERIYYPK